MSASIRQTISAPPVAAGGPPEAPAYLERGRGCWLWIVPRCPRCGKRHQHGGGPLGGDPRALLGHRAASCAGRAHQATGYVLIEAPAVVSHRRKAR